MSMKQFSVTNNFFPFVGQQNIKEIFAVHGQKALLRSKNNAVKHNACWNDALDMPDPDCSVCGGSGFEFVDRLLKRVILQMKEPRGQADGRVNIHTRAGQMEYIAGVMYLLPVDAKIVFNNDVIVYPYNNLTPQIEFVVDNKIPYFVTGDVPIMYRLELFKSIKPQSVTETGRDI